MAALDHLVVLAHTLDQGVAWCEKTLGVTPGPGGEHPLMGSHNRLLRIDSTAFPRVYLEIIAINSVSSSALPVGSKRWFDMDNELLQKLVQQTGPQLIHWVARVPDVHCALQGLKPLGIDCGKVVEASRGTPAGLLKWQITVRADGQRLFDGCLPALIQWDGPHPTDNMAHSGLKLGSFHLAHPSGAELKTAFQTIGLNGLKLRSGPASIHAMLQTPNGVVQLKNKSI